MSINANRTIEIFEQIDQIPRESFKEEAVSCFIKEWAENLGLEVVQDENWNLLIRKPGTPGYEECGAVIIQAHTDMVCEKEPDSTHNFDTDPIVLKADGDWVVSAVGTSIGADNAIGVATAMRILEDETLEHPPLEVVFTVREEVDFYGAESFDKSLLSGRMFINLDFEVDTELIAGSCGGFGAYFRIPVKRASAKNLVPYRINLGGLLGGHSGEDIHRGRGNAIVMLARMLNGTDYSLASMDGGTNRLAISRDVSAVIYAAENESFEELKEAFNELKKEIGKPADGAALTIEPEDEAIKPMDAASANKVLTALLLYPNGPIELSGDFPGSIESSNNIGIIETSEEMVVITSEARGQHKSSFEYTGEKIMMLASLLGAEAEFFTRYEPWEYVADSKLRETATATYKEMFGDELEVLVLHAGLECSNFTSAIDGLDVIAIGPNCENLHSPTERVSIKSVEKHYRYITALLKNLK